MKEIPGIFSDPEESAFAATDVIDQCRTVIAYLKKSEPPYAPRGGMDNDGLEFARAAMFDVVIDLMGRAEKTLRNFVKERRE